jgi:UPF0271 protein
MRRIDINCDMGEIPEAIAGGDQEAIMPFLSSVNIACGGHAGDEATMIATIEQARRWNLSIGAHPGYPDRANFGRLQLPMSAADIERTVFEQVQFLAEVAARQGVALRHVKPHGALYNAAAVDREVARPIAAGVARWSRDVILVGLAGSLMIDVFREAGFTTASEAFADRRYEPDGTLRARRYPDALITDPALAAQQVIKFVEDQRAQTVCIHGDTSGARDIAAEVSRTLREHAIAIQPL